MDYWKIHDVAEKWKVSPRRIQTLCAQGRIEGAVRFGRDWMIPKHTKRPIDGRTKAAQHAGAKQEQPFPRQTPFLYMSDLYSTPGTAEEQIKRLAGNHDAQVLFEAELAYSKGEIDKAYHRAKYLLDKKTGFYATLSAGMLLALCAIWRGDLTLWRQAKVYLSKAPVTSPTDRDVIDLSITAVDSMLYYVESFPEWFKIGCFEPLHRDSLPAAKVFYAKYLYAVGYAVATRQFALEGVQGLALIAMLPNTIEPMISQAMADRTLIAEAYLRLTCAAVYRSAGNDEQAIRHIDRAIALALPDRLYGLLAEYGRTLDTLLEQRIGLVSQEALERVKALYQTYNKNWSYLSGNVRGKTLITTLSRKEREVAKLAAFGMRNAQIAQTLHMSLSGVKQAIRIVSEKTGVGRDEFAAFL